MDQTHTYSVFRDGSHTAICVAVERKYTYFIPMEASVVRVVRLEHPEFKELYSAYAYPVRRAAEVYLYAPDKEITPEARGHLEAIMADPAYVYDSSQFPPLTVTKDNIMAKKNAAAVAEEIAVKPKNKKEALQAAAKQLEAAPPVDVKAGKPAAKAAAEKPAAKAAPAKKAAKAEAATEGKPRGRAPAVDPATRLKVGEVSGVRSGFMLAFIQKAQELEKASRGKGFLGSALVDAMVGTDAAGDHDAAWVRTYLSYSLAPARGHLVVA